MGTCIRENRAVVIEDIEQDARMAPWRQRARKYGLRYAARLSNLDRGQGGWLVSSLCAVRRFL